ncbi:hypothetical protein Fcan01_11580 [Folsomia candida]|uniref:Uncharacterized protein n=1 Tax=Folsomia candida TaxID=158441 RepID=A0A226ED38_FOLCA|nr:hypothetical protein Fcan01_11580 [Folsomia candida]
MLIKDIFFIKRNLMYGTYFGCLFVKWDRKQEKVVVRSKGQKVGILTTLVVHFFICLTRFFVTFKYTSSLVDQAEAGMGAVIYTTAFLLRLDLPIDLVSVQLVNFLIAQTNNDFGRTKLQLCINFLYGAAEVTGLFLSVIISTLTILTPCQPILLSCLFCKDGGLLTGQSHTTIYAIKLSFAVLEFISLQQLVTTSVYYLATVLLHGISFLWMSCTTFVRGYIPGCNIARLLAYKELKVYEKLLNYCTKSRIFLITALLVPGLQILLCYTSLKLFHSEDISNFEASLFLWAYFLVLVFTMLLFSAAAQINNLSVNWIAKFKGSSDKRLERRMHKSLMSLRLEFGNNFVETLTPLVVQEFCVRQTASCLLVKR